MKHKAFFSALACSTLIITGCGKADTSAVAAMSSSSASTPTVAAGTAKSTKASNETPEDQWESKAQSYIQINNRLASFSTPTNEFFARSFAAAKERVRQGNFKSIRSDTSYFDDSFVKRMTDALIKPGDMPALDGAARQLLDATNKYMPNWVALEAYNKAKKYEDDNGEKGKEMLPAYREGMDKIDAALAIFSAQVDTVAKEANERLTAHYKANGKLMELNKLQAMTAARAIADAFDSQKDLKDKAKIDAANAQLAVMEDKIEQMKVEHAKRKSEDPKSLPTIDRYDRVFEKLTSFAGKYRAARKSPVEFNAAIEEFNSAIEENNLMMR